jgi:PAS domain S-box-containing protein
MTGTNRTKKQLMEELGCLRRRIDELEAVEAEHKRIEQELKLGGQILDEIVHILESAIDPIFIHDAEGNLIYVNEAAVRSHGYTKEEFLKINLYKLEVAWSSEMGEARMKEILEYRSAVFEVEHYHKDGSILHLEMHTRPVEIDGNLIFLTAVHDITDRKQLEQALQKSERHHRTLVENAIEGIVVTQEGRIKFVNPVVAIVSGYSTEELQSMSLKDLVHPDDEEAVIESLGKSAAPGTLHITPPFRFRTKGGEMRWIEATVVSIIWDDKAANLNLLRDITESKRVEEELRDREAKFRYLFEHSQIANALVGLDGKIIDVNQAAADFYGYDKDEIIGKNLLEFIAPESKTKVTEAFAHGLVHTHADPLEVEAITKEGKRTFFFPGGYHTLFEGGKETGFLISVVDITQRKRAEEERRQLEQKAQFSSRLASVGELAAGVAHEINNPLTAVIGYASLLLDRKDIPGDIRRDLEVINVGARRVAGIVGKLLVFARQTKPERKYIDINEIVSATLDLRAYSLQSSNVKVILQLDPDLPKTVADPAQLQQVFLNLIINAETEIKLGHGGGKLAIKTEKIGDNFIRISFRDNGLGIDKKNLDRIFDPFFTTRKVGEGTGLGLSVCHGIVTEHKGRIWAESQLGKGATFIVELLVVAADEQLELPEPVVEEAQKVAKAKILVVDDETVVSQFVNEILTDEGHEVEAVDSAEKALEKVKGEKYEVIMLDIKMPGMSGIELYRYFQQTSPTLAERVVFITGDVMGASTTAFLSKTKVPYVIKPFDAGQVKTEINRVLAEKASKV